MNEAINNEPEGEDQVESPRDDDEAAPNDVEAKRQAILKKLYADKIAALTKGPNVTIFKPRMTMFQNVYNVTQKFSFNTNNKIGSGSYAQVYEAF